jgi:endoglucanase
MDEDATAFLERLVASPSPSGSEDAAIAHWRDRLADHAATTETDAYGNTVATLNPGAGTSLVLAGHADEIAFMVNHVTDEGFVYVERVGGVDAAIAEGRRVTLHGTDGPVSGVTGRKPIHLQEDEEREETPDIEDVYVDVGAPDAEAVEDAGIRVGDYITYDVGFESLQGDVVAGRGLDNRIGIWAAAEALRGIDPDELDVTVHAVATVQEELGLRGARMIGYDLDPDVVLAVDVTFATDVPGIEPTAHGDVALGDGPCLKHGKENHPAVVERLEDVARNGDLPLQHETLMTRGATDADAFSVARGAVPTASVGVPNRNMHTTSELVDLRDLSACRELLAGFATSLEPDAAFEPF